MLVLQDEFLVFGKSIMLFFFPFLFFSCFDSCLLFLSLRLDFDCTSCPLGLDTRFSLPQHDFTRTGMNGWRNGLVIEGDVIPDDYGVGRELALARIVVVQTVFKSVYYTVNQSNLLHVTFARCMWDSMSQLCLLDALDRITRAKPRHESTSDQIRPLQSKNTPDVRAAVFYHPTHSSSSQNQLNNLWRKPTQINFKSHQNLRTRLTHIPTHQPLVISPRKTLQAW